MDDYKGLIYGKPAQKYRLMALLKKSFMKKKLNKGEPEKTFYLPFNN